LWLAVVVQAAKLLPVVVAGQGECYLAILLLVIVLVHIQLLLAVADPLLLELRHHPEMEVHQQHLVSLPLVEEVVVVMDLLLLVAWELLPDLAVEAREVLLLQLMEDLETLLQLFQDRVIKGEMVVLVRVAAVEVVEPVAQEILEQHRL
jgi:hypothetical protein